VLPRGSRTARTTSHSVEAHGTGHGIEVRVADTGIGIAADFLPRIFDRFAQMNRPAHRRSGLGLGLALAKEIVTAHGGTEATILSFLCSRSTIALISVARLHRRFGARAPVRTQRSAHVVHLLELASRGAFREHLVFAGVDQFTFRRTALRYKLTSGGRGASRVPVPTRGHDTPT
jgi:signal transduction histidine kinase